MVRRSVRTSRQAVLCLFVLSSLLCAPVQSGAGEAEYTNVIVLVGDGMGSTHTTATRWYKGVPLSLDGMYLGGVRTYGADSLITDSAPAATALACGHKSSDKFIGVMPDSGTMPGVSDPGPAKGKPIPSVLEGAKLLGKSVGIVATSNIQHATPAAYSSHWPDRSNYNEIAEQQVYHDIDVVFGGGRKYLLPKTKGGSRTDGEDLLEVLKSKGYAVVETREEMLKTTSRKVWGMFANDAMAYEFDRKEVAPEEPSLSEMTAKAITILSKNPKGFFLFVEGSKIDWASHANDPIGVISDVLAFDDAVGVALDFARKKRRTLVLAFTDHGNGGMSIGSKSTDKTYSHLRYEAVFAPLKKASLTGEGVEKLLKGERSEERIREVVSKRYGIDDLTPEEIKAIQSAKAGDMNYALGPIMSSRSHIGWTTNGHTGEDTFLYLYGIKKPVGLVENTDIARMVAEGLGFDLAATGKRLFAAAEEAFKGTGATLHIDDGDPNNKMLVVEGAGRRVELPLSKNLMRIGAPGGKEYQLEGITIFAPKTGTVYVPRQAGSIFMNAGTSRR